MKNSIRNIILIAGSMYLFVMACNEVYRQPVIILPAQTAVLQPTLLFDSALLPQDSNRIKKNNIYTRNTSPYHLLEFARGLMGTPYVYGASDPQTGFDCSGFIYHVFNHFGIQVPRSSVGFTNLSKEIPLNAARPGDLVLFTRTDSGATVVGHMGIIESKKEDGLHFIHSSSGKANGVTISPLDGYYMTRFVKVIRIFPDSTL